VSCELGASILFCPEGRVEISFQIVNGAKMEGMTPHPLRL